MTDPTRSEMDDLLGAYALDAVDPDERAVIERHLAVDADARAEVDEMRETASVLASLPREDAGAPEGLWDRIAGAIGAPDTALDDVRSEVVADTRPEPEVAPPIPITRAKSTRAKSYSIPARVLVPIVSAAALIIAVLAISIAARPASKTGNVAAAYNHAVSSGAAQISLQKAGGGGAAADIALAADGSGYLRNDTLPALPSGKTYQLWALEKQGQKPVVAISAGVLGPDPSAVAFHVAHRPASFAITVEDAPGVVVSKHAPVASAPGIPA